MRILRDHLKIMFGKIKPEMMIKNIKQHGMRDNGIDKALFRVSGCMIDKSAYIHYSHSIYWNLTYEEAEARYFDMTSAIERRANLGGSNTVFALLPEYTCHVLKEECGNLVCRQKEFLNWRDCYFVLGQDLLTSAHLAYKSYCEARTVTDFGWSAMIETDDRRFFNIIDKGLAENHFHLNGSTRGFDLSWLCLMNHPERISGFFGRKPRELKDENINTLFMVNLNDSFANSEYDNSISWIETLNIACWLRAQLFKWLANREYVPYRETGSIRPVEDFCRFLSETPSALTVDLCDEIDTVRFVYGLAGKAESGSFGRIDYAITPRIAAGISSGCATRSLVGERSFLYNALYCIFSHDCDYYSDFVDMFYLYILIKIKFRSELIQVNKRYGFKNFARYQDRKDIIFETFPEYDNEAKNLSVNDGLKCGHIRSLEMRITPGETAAKQRDKIIRTDETIWRLGEGNRAFFKNFKKEYVKDVPYFYVIHFPKFTEKFENDPLIPENPNWIYYLIYGVPRNNKVRMTTAKQAKAIAKALSSYTWLWSRMRGVDACTFEIGCRPEVFATEFRFLRGLVSQPSDFYSENISASRLCVTYHVGEDFMDILDGLRAIDEALVFLEMESGDRLGHALALGVDAHEYYSLKNNAIVLSKQDYLDNIVWALNKANALNIDTDSALQQQLRGEARHLIGEIYGREFDIWDYYNSYLLRGDSPELYRYGFFNEKEYKQSYQYRDGDICGRYNFCQIQQRYHKERLDDFRRNSKAVKLFWMYHFNNEIKIKGSFTERKKVSEAYIRLTNEIQKGIRKELVKRHIAIECNPSSNVLIGPFDRYDEHPIFRFYPVVPKDNDELQFVSVNTDDQGVFDTSLETEYALILGALQSMKNENGLPLYNDDVIYGYIERLRENGFAQAFTLRSKETSSVEGAINVPLDIDEKIWYNKT